MDVDTLIIVEEVAPGRQGLFLNPVREDGEVVVSTTLDDCWLALEGFRVRVPPGQPVGFRTPPGRHQAAFEHGTERMPLGLHCDPNGDARIEIQVYRPGKVLTAKLVSRVAGTLGEHVAVGLQTQPQGVAATVVVGHGGGELQRVELPASRPFARIDLDPAHAPFWVRIEQPAPDGEAEQGGRKGNGGADDPEPIQVGGTDQVDIIVEPPLGDRGPAASATARAGGD